MQNPHNHPVRLRLPPLHRRGISWCRTHTTTPSGCACHPSTGEELAGAEPTQPPRQAEPDTPPKEGNCLPPQEGNCLLQIRCHHPVKLRLPPLRRRGIACLHRRGISWCRTHTTTPSGCACRVQTRYDCSSVFVLVISPPQEGN